MVWLGLHGEAISLKGSYKFSSAKALAVCSPFQHGFYSISKVRSDELTIAVSQVAVNEIQI